MLHFCDGFDSYTETADLIKHKWHKYKQYIDENAPTVDKMGNWEWNSTEGVNGGGCIKHVGPAIGDQMGTEVVYFPRQYNGRSQYSTLFWVKIAEPPANREMLCQWAQVDNNGDFRISLTLYINPDGTFEFVGGETRAQFVTTVFYTSTFSICDNVYHCIEIRADLASHFSSTTFGTGQFKLGYDSFVLFDGDVDVRGIFNVKTVTFFSIGVVTWIDDFIFWDEAGDNPVAMPWGDMTDTRADEFLWDWYNDEPVNSDLNNFPERGQDDFFYWMGPRQITTLRPASDGTINDFEVVGAATKLDAVDDAMPDLSKYLVHDQAGARMVFNLEDFTYDVPVYSVVVNALTVMEDFGSIVAHAEALVSPDFETGVRRRVSGNYEVVSNGVNIMVNGGPDFVDTTGWSGHHDASVSVVDGNLRITHTSTSHTDPDPLVEIAVPVTPNRHYMVTMQRPIRKEDESTSGVNILGATVSADKGSAIDNVSASNSLTETTRVSERWYVPPYVSTLYIQLLPTSAATPGYSDVDWITIEEMVPTWDFKYYQWAFRHDPATDLEWTQAGINAAEFGMRIAP